MNQLEFQLSQHSTRIAITGHRPDKLGYDYDLKSTLILRIREKVIDVLYDLRKEKILCITGMALGIDTLFAKIAIECEIPFIAAIPCEGQELRWPEKSQKTYRDIINNPLCTKHYVSQEAYSSSVMQKRNEWMVDNSTLLIAVWDGTSGGTANCVKYAGKVGRRMIRINPKML